MAAFALLPAAGMAAERTVARADWSAPATVEAAARRPALNRVLAAYLEKPGQWVRIAHDGEAPGSSWAGEVRGWLVALGIPGQRIRMDPGMASPDQLVLDVHAEGEQP
jgi:hypothetical protein